MLTRRGSFAGILAGAVLLAADASEANVGLLQQACKSCHRTAFANGGLNLESRESTLRGGVSGPAIVAGNASRSLLISRLREAPGRPRMPPAPAAPLTDAEQATLRAWIDAGAAWPMAVAADFRGQIEPIFKARCIHCHGSGRREKGLRLDTRTGALRGGLAGPVIQPGQAAESTLVKRLLGQVAPRMPYQEPPLPPDQVALIRDWIDAGAPGPDDRADAGEERHWAYVKPVRPAAPAVRRQTWVRNEIDSFVLSRLEREGLAPSADASRETLLRRVSLDLTGLPPTLEELDAFLADSGGDAYDKVVERLLASPHYAERWARPWLDLARYADTNGYEKDRRRAAWKWRDWVIAALNADMPFRQFTIEQLAGDMLKDATLEQRVATGFHRNTLLNQEGGIDVEEARFETLVDRVNTTAAVWLGSTLGCAQCHDHKFDPFTQKDYYKMLAFFDNGEYKVFGEGPKVMDRWIVEPELELGTPEQAARKKSLEEEIALTQARLETTTPELAAQQAAWERARAAAPPIWTTLVPATVTSSGGATLEVGADGGVSASGTNPDYDTYTLVVRAPRPVAALRLETLPDPTAGRSEAGGFVLTRVGVGGERLRSAEADTDSNPTGLLDQDTATSWSGGDPGRSSTAVIQLAKPLRSGGPLTITLEHQGRQPRQNLRRFRLSATSSASPWGGLALPERLRPAQPKELAAYYRSIAPALESARLKLRELRKQLAELAIPTAMVLRERPGGERPSTPLRIRGSFMSPGERVFAGVPGALHGLADDAMPNRLGLALWLADENNPLTPRVTVNRIWEQYFGRGLVETSEDFGTQGGRPSHPELLDWLATELLRHGTRQKPLHRLIVTSATYRQSSRVTQELRERDPWNRLLARGPRFRVEAEMVRDIALSVSGLLDPKLGGPSVFPFQPEGIWDNPYSDDRWRTSEGGDRYRRALYTFVRRTAPYPSLAVFDAPSREFCTARRVRTSTPLQALTTLNDPFFVEAARALAARTLREAGPAPEERAAHAFRLCTARRPEAAELLPILSFQQQQLARLRDDAAAELASWTMVASVLLNLDETLTKQ